MPSAKSSAMANKTNGKTPSKTTPPGGMTKADAVRKAFGQLGKTAMPVKVREYLRKTYGLDMETNAISKYKTELSRKAARSKPAVARKAPAPAPKPTAPATNGLSGRVALDDVRTLKGLLGRISASNLKALIDMLAR